jgi:formylglycine-generating enzyme required for sulfatase activity
MKPTILPTGALALLLGMGAGVLAGCAAASVPASTGRPDENSLGMKFVPVPGTPVLFSIWETRVRDFEAFSRAAGYHATAESMLTWNEAGQLTTLRGSFPDPWLKPSPHAAFTNGPDFPVVCVTWTDSQAFCRWLTDKERREGRLGADREYRLPTDAEWSLAAGLSGEGDGSPADKRNRIKGQYPWGTQWPPPAGAGNFRGEEWNDGHGIPGYRDGFQFTSPVGSFRPNPYGLYDVSGNVFEWCLGEDGAGRGVLRGGSFADNNVDVNAGSLQSSFRQLSRTTVQPHALFGFRVVLAAVGTSPAAGNR